MSLQFIMNRADQNPLPDLLKSSLTWLDEKQCHEVFYLVPNHVKFEMEINILKELESLTREKDRQYMTSMKLQIFSFSRLAWYFMQHTKMYQSTRLSDSGKFMLIKKSLLACQDELTLFKKEIDRPGFISQLVELFDEFEDGCITVHDLKEMTEVLNEHHASKELFKIVDIYTIYSTYMDILMAHQISQEDLLLELANFLKQEDLSYLQISLLGFSNFTAVEQELIETLLLVSGEVKMNIIMDKASRETTQEAYQLFFNGHRLYHQFYQLTRESDIPILFDKYVSDTTNELMKDIGLGWQDLQEISIAKKAKQDVSQALSIWSCDDTYTELRAVGAEIRRLVSEKGYRYQDIIVLYRDFEPYAGQLTAVFDNSDIPFYLNEETQMKYHPLVEWLISLFQINQRFYQSKDVMRFLRTELLFPSTVYAESSSFTEATRLFRKQVDLTENVVLAQGYTGKDWISNQDWNYVTYQFSSLEVTENTQEAIQEATNEIRGLIKQHLPTFFEQMKASQTGLEGITIFYNFLLNLGIDRQMLNMQQQELDRGNLVEAKNHEQTWQSLMNLLDEYVELMGEEAFDFDVFSEVIISGLEGLTYGKVPTSLDQVSVSSLDMVRAKKYKATFLIGATDHVLPQKIENKSLLSNDERSFFSEYLPSNHYLGIDLGRQMANEPFIFYQALLSATNHIYLSYPKQIDQVKDLNMSPYLSQLLRYFIVDKQEKSLIYLGQQEELLQDVSTNKLLLSDLVRILRATQDEKVGIPWIWQQLKKRLETKMPTETSRLLASLTHKNIPEKLNEETVDMLYGDTIYASVSKIESFNKCEYQYFLTYGLDLKERAIFELSPAATGEFYHEALDIFFKKLIESKCSLSEMSFEEVAVLSQRVLDDVLGKPQFDILKTTNRMNYIKYQLEQTIRRVCWALKEQALRSGMNTIQTEVLFGEILQKKGLDSLIVPLKNDKKLSVRGKIDRVDELVLDGVPYISVVDYKSSAHNFDFTDAYVGLSMQMITYLDVALRNAVKLVGDEAKPAGAFYMHVKNPVILGNEKFHMDKLEQDLVESYRLDGLLVEDSQLLKKMDKTVSPGEKSLVYPFNQIKKEEAMRSAKFVTDDDLDALIHHNRELFEKAGNHIYQGSNQLNPSYKDKTRIACGFCPYKSICQFDVMLKENNYHRIDHMKKDDVIKRIQSGGENHDDSN
ncbi:PD-(D/E)XK nuclease family protein [Vagococcus jeotgali]|uniref:PD-(D/E)XK nuclease family protein n=1 Tax=Vagococcus jeotgali TaxID=3109030 RepID=UPI002DDB8A20|nr:PD-(D/E)XK nuclease family protein [Vagococcus sp. B2T-5]